MFAFYFRAIKKTFANGRLKFCGGTITVNPRPDGTAGIFHIDIVLSILIGYSTYNNSCSTCITIHIMHNIRLGIKDLNGVRAIVFKVDTFKAQLFYPKSDENARVICASNL